MNKIRKNISVELEEPLWELLAKLKEVVSYKSKEDVTLGSLIGSIVASELLENTEDIFEEHDEVRTRKVEASLARGFSESKPKRVATKPKTVASGRHPNTRDEKEK